MSEDHGIEDIRRHVLVHEAHAFVAETLQSAKIKTYEHEAERILREENIRENPDERRIEQTEAVMSLLSLQYAALRKGEDPLKNMAAIHPRMEEWLDGVNRLPDTSAAPAKVIREFINKRGAFAAEVDRFRIMQEDPAAEFVNLAGEHLKALRRKQSNLIESLDKMNSGQATGPFKVELLHDRMVWDLNDLEERIDITEAVQSGLSLYLADKYTNIDGQGFEHPHKKQWTTNLQTFLKETTGLDEKKKLTKLEEFIGVNGAMAREIDEAHSKWEHQLELGSNK